MRSVARALARGPLLARLSRRQLLSSASLIALSACAGQTVATGSGTATQTTPGIGSTIASIVSTVASAVSGVLTQLGLSSTDLGKVTSLVSQLSGIATQISGDNGSGLSSLLSDAMGVIGLITPFIPGGTLLTAIMTAMSTAQGLISGQRMAAAAPGAMTHDQAMGILRDAAAGRLPR